METELAALKNNGTLIILPPDVKHVGGISGYTKSIIRQIAQFRD